MARNFFSTPFRKRIIIPIIPQPRVMQILFLYLAVSHVETPGRQPSYLYEKKKSTPKEPEQARDIRKQKSLATLLQGFVARTRFELVSPP